MKLKRILLAAVLAGVLAPAIAAEKSVSLVKIVNFACPISRASEIQDISIRTAVAGTGGKFIVAPLPNEEGTYARERVYYAARKQGEIAETKVRESLYRGTQDVNLPLTDIYQVLEWLKDDLNSAGINWQQLKADADSPEAREALGRAASIAVRAGVQALPSYILVQDNAPVATLDTTNTSKGASLLALRDEVLSRINQLADGKK